MQPHGLKLKFNCLDIQIHILSVWDVVCSSSSCLFVLAFLLFMCTFSNPLKNSCLCPNPSQSPASKIPLTKLRPANFSTESFFFFNPLLLLLQTIQAFSRRCKLWEQIREDWGEWSWPPWFTSLVSFTAAWLEVTQHSTSRSASPWHTFLFHYHDHDHLDLPTWN